MIALLVTAGLLSDPTLPPLSDADRLPSTAISHVQERRCGEWRDRMELLGRVRGWEGGVWGDARDDFEFNRSYWEAVEAVNDAWPDGQRRVMLRALRGLVGADRYQSNWRPREMPEVPPLTRTKGGTDGTWPGGTAQGGANGVE